MGLHYRAGVGWVWQGDDQVRGPTETSWAANEPSCDPACDDNDAVLLQANATWYVADQGEPHPYLCQRATPWFLRPEDAHAYQLLPLSGWLAGDITCRLFPGGHLVTVSSPEEQAL